MDQNAENNRLWGDQPKWICLQYSSCPLGTETQGKKEQKEFKKAQEDCCELVFLRNVREYTP